MFSSSDIRFGKHLAKQTMPLAKVMSATGNSKATELDSEQNELLQTKYLLTAPCHLMASCSGQLHVWKDLASHNHSPAVLAMTI